MIGNPYRLLSHLLLVFIVSFSVLVAQEGSDLGEQVEHRRGSQVIELRHAQHMKPAIDTDNLAGRTGSRIRDKINSRAAHRFEGRS